MLNKKFSYRDFTGRSLQNNPTSDFDGSDIVGSCFAQATPRTKVFPDGIRGVTFRKCNLDNVFVPLGNTVSSDCQHRNIVRQKDRMDWVVEDNGKPIEPVAKKEMQALGLSIKPKDIPLIITPDSVYRIKIRELAAEIERV